MCSIVDSRIHESEEPNLDFPIDAAVMNGLPSGSKIREATQFGTSAWTITARILATMSDGSQKRFFLKVANDASGRLLIEGEFHAMAELHKTMPGLVPEPFFWGKYEAEYPETFFMVSEFVDISQRMPDPKQLCSRIAELHRISKSPTGMFGFHVATCQGRIHQSVGWEKSWTAFFTKLLKHVIDLDLEHNGAWRELEQLADRILSKVIPRLIGVLEEDGRTVKPCLIHGDLWEGNTGTSYESGNVYIFDSAAFYAHHEMEVGDWRCRYNKIHNKVYTRTYLRHYVPSEPREEWDDRNRMYCIYFNVIYSVNHQNQGTAVRQTAYDDMYYLIEKYAPFADGEGPPRLQDSERAALSLERDHTLI